MPAARTLQAANAYEMIVKAVDNSTEAADQAKDAAENAASMVSCYFLKNDAKQYFSYCLLHTSGMIPNAAVLQH